MNLLGNVQSNISWIGWQSFERIFLMIVTKHYIYLRDWLRELQFSWHQTWTNFIFLLKVRCIFLNLSIFTLIYIWRLEALNSGLINIKYQIKWQAPKYRENWRILPIFVYFLRKNIILKYKIFNMGVRYP